MKSTKFVSNPENWIYREDQDSEGEPIKRIAHARHAREQQHSDYFSLATWKILWSGVVGQGTQGKEGDCSRDDEEMTGTEPPSAPPRTRKAREKSGTTKIHLCSCVVVAAAACCCCCLTAWNQNSAASLLGGDLHNRASISMDFALSWTLDDLKFMKTWLTFAFPRHEQVVEVSHNLSGVSVRRGITDE